MLPPRKRHLLKKRPPPKKKLLRRKRLPQLLKLLPLSPLMKWEVVIL
jgi:hypothetical protein